MSNIKHQDIISALSKIIDPQSGKDLISGNMIKNLQVEGSEVRFTIEYKSQAHPNKEQLLEQTKSSVQELEGVESVQVNSVVNDPLKVISGAPGRPQSGGPGPQAGHGGPQPQPKMLPEVKYSIAVASGKGGVGKTTVSVNLAVALAKTGVKVGLLDADIYGPNVPIMMGIHDTLGTRNNKIAPLRRYDVDMVSVGFISQGDAAIIWRGPLVGRMIQQFLQDVDWGELDYLIIDLPPGTGDAQLTLTQTLPLTGSIVVCTPQLVALSDAIKGINMFKKVEVPILGLVENMSYFVAPDTGKRYDIFGHGGGREAAKKLKVPFLGEVPLEQAARVGGDEGKPIVHTNPESASGKAFTQIAETIKKQLEEDESEDTGLLKRVFKIN